MTVIILFKARIKKWNKINYKNISEHVFSCSNSVSDISDFFICSAIDANDDDIDSDDVNNNIHDHDQDK